MGFDNPLRSQVKRRSRLAGKQSASQRRREELRARRMVSRIDCELGVQFNVQNAKQELLEADDQRRSQIALALARRVTMKVDLSGQDLVDAALSVFDPESASAIGILTFLVDFVSSEQGAMEAAPFIVEHVGDLIELEDEQQLKLALHLISNIVATNVELRELFLPFLVQFCALCEELTRLEYIHPAAQTSTWLIGNFARLEPYISGVELLEIATTLSQLISHKELDLVGEAAYGLANCVIADSTIPQMLSEEGIISQIVQKMHQIAFSSETIVPLVRIIANTLALDDFELVSYVIECGCLPPLHTLANIGTESQKIEAFSALANAAASGGYIIGKLLEDSIISSVTDTLIDSSTHRDVKREAAFTLLWTLEACNSGHIRELLCQGVIESLHAITSGSYQDPKITIAIGEILPYFMHKVTDADMFSSFITKGLECDNFWESLHRFIGENLETFDDGMEVLYDFAEDLISGLCG